VKSPTPFVLPSLALRVCVLLLGGAAQAASPPEVTQVRVGLPGGTATNRSRNGAWAPVYATLKAGGEGNPQGAFRLVVEATDGEEIPYRYAVPVPALAAGEQRIVLAYARPGTDGGEFTVKVQTPDGRTLHTAAKVRRDSSNLKREIIDPQDVLYLTLGSRLPGLSRAVQPQPNDQADDAENGTRGFAVIENADLLPDRWFGCEAVDVVVLATGGEGFVTQLLQDGAAARRDALLEWVRRGGRLVLSVGRNHQLVGRLLDKLPLLDCGIQGSVTRAALTNVTTWAGREAQQVQQQPLREVEIACLRPGRDTYIVVREDADAADLERRPVIVQGPCGLGRVMLVAFDLDGEKFGKWESQAVFWKKLQAEVAPRPVGRGERRELGEEMQRAVETFGEVPVTSFGWVALFLLFYIVLVGPLDYFVLKKVFKRLEMTWVTFPLMVLVVSVAAYLAAYWLKGDDLWINKVDLVEVDLHGPPRVYGSTWFALFNPRSQGCTVGLAPASPGWSAPPAAGEANREAAVMLAPLEAPQRTVPGSPGLFRRPYEYAADATGLRGVPVPVWATRTFAASWRAPASAVPPVEADVRLSRDGNALAGTIVNHLPVELQGVGLFYRGQWYTVPTLMPEQRLEVQTLFERGVPKKPIADWFSDPAWVPHVPVAAFTEPSRPQVLAAQKSYRVVMPLLFHALGGNGEATDNSGLRTLDQSWRVLPLSTVPTPPQLQYLDEAILVGRAPSVTDRAETVTAGPSSPSRLWLDALPGGGATRPALEGHLSQETYVRVFIPVRKDR
jgi:hypothetical protein